MKYKTALKKYSLKKILKMYMNGELELNEKEWRDIHKRLERKRMQKYYFTTKLDAFILIIISATIILLAAILSQGNYRDEVNRCNKLKGHTCTKYEIEKMGDK